MIQETIEVDGRRWHKRDYQDEAFVYSRDGEEFDVVLLDRHGEPTGTKRVRHLDELEPKSAKRAHREPGPDRPWVIQLPPVGYDAPPPFAIRATPGTVFVEMDVYRDAIGMVQLTDLMRGALRPDSGWIVASGDPGCKVGEHVLLAPYGGTEFDGFEVGGQVAKGRVKIFGAAGRDPYEIEYEDWRDNVIAGVEERLVAKGDWVLIRRDPTVVSEHGLELPGGMQYRTHKATVVSAGPDAHVKDGDRVMYHSGGVMYGIAFDQGEYEFEGDPADHVFIRSANLFGVIDE